MQLILKKPDLFPTGAIIGEVSIVDCINNSKSVWALPDHWHWMLEDAKFYDKPILGVKGRLGIWNYEPELIKS